MRDRECERVNESDMMNERTNFWSTNFELEKVEFAEQPSPGQTLSLFHN